MNDEGHEPSLVQRLFQIGSKLFAMAARHFRLLNLEAQEEARAWVCLACAAIAVVAIALFAFVLLNCALIVFIATATGAWVATLAGAGALYALLAVFLAWRLRRWWRSRPDPFPVTLSELDKTREWLTELWPTRSDPKN